MMTTEDCDNNNNNNNHYTLNSVSQHHVVDAVDSNSNSNYNDGIDNNNTMNNALFGKMTKQDSSLAVIEDNNSVIIPAAGSVQVHEGRVNHLSTKKNGNTQPPPIIVTSRIQPAIQKIIESSTRRRRLINDRSKLSLVFNWILVLCIHRLLDTTSTRYFVASAASFSSRELKERTILIELYQQTSATEDENNADGIPGEMVSDWFNATGWSSSLQNNDTQSHVCEWYGVECVTQYVNDTTTTSNTNITEQVVTGLNLNKNNLIAIQLPTTLYTLEDLKYLNLHGNIILDAGFPTTTVNAIAPLEYIDMSDCMLSDISGISSFYDTLQELHLSRNKYLGTISSYLNRTKVNGDIVATSNTSSSSKSTFPIEILNLSNLLSLSLNMNNIKGTIPFDIYKLSNLVDLDLNLNQFTGTIPSSMNQLTKLQILNLGDNLLTGYITNDIIPCTTHLRILNLQGRSYYNNIGSDNSGGDNNNSSSIGDGYFYGPLPTFEDCINLHTLLLGYNKFNGTIPGHFLYNSEVGQDIYMSGSDNSTLEDTTSENRFTGTLTVSLVNNFLTGTIPIEMYKFDVLDIELIGNTNIIGPIYEDLCSKERWMRGLVKRYGCDAILCPPGTYNDLGQQVSQNNPCLPCSSSIASTDQRLGALECSSDNDTTNTNDSNNDPLMSSPSLNGVTQEIKELLILAEFYYALEGPSRWANKSGWEQFDAFFASGTTYEHVTDLESTTILQDVEKCEFFGVMCNPSTSEVAFITLPNNGLAGIIPGTLFQLPDLTGLDLSYNRVSLINTDSDIDNEHIIVDDPTTTIGFEVLQNAPKLNRIKLSNTEIDTLYGIGKAISLAELELDGCDLDEPFPSELFTVTSLKALHLEACYIKGPIPTEIGRLTNLDRLYLNQNRLTGAIPGEISKLANLRYLDLSDNDLGGNLPSSIGELTRLLSLRMNSCRGNLGGPLPSFEKLSHIEDLEFAFNDFTGVIPTNFLSGRHGNSTRLKVRLTRNSLEGTVPLSFANFSSLVLELEDNKITALPEELCQNNLWMDGEVGLVTNPCEAILCPNGYYSPYGRAVTRDSTSCLECPNNVYFGETVCEASNLVKNREVEVLDLLFSATGGRSWNAPHIKNWTKPGVPICYREGVYCGYKPAGMNSGVTELRLDSFGLSGRIPSEIYELSQLRRLSIAKNQVDISFYGIEKTKDLEVVNVAYTNVNTMAGLEKAGDKLYDLHVAGASLITFPTEILQIITLRGLSLEDNRITGPIPSEIGNLRNLAKLGLRLNEFTGTLPTEIALLTDLTLLDVSSNVLSGLMPSELGALTMLTTLNLAYQRSENRFAGPLYPLATNTKLTYLNVSGNELEGEVPSNLLAGVNKTSHVVIDLSRNKLTGSVPIELRDFEVLNIDLAGNMISSLSPDLCKNPSWMDGILRVVPRENQCDAILCPQGTFAAKGKQLHRSGACTPCLSISEAPYLGSLECRNPLLTSERKALIDFSDATSGESWIFNENWLSDLSVCAWYGVECDTNGTVVGLRLGNNGLVQNSNDSDVFDFVNRLENLKILSLDGNAVNVDFRSIRNDSVLEIISVSGVGLQSLEGVKNAQNLQRIVASNNNLTGPFPQDLLEMQKLTEIVLSGNSIRGLVPAALFELTNLQHLLLEGNQLTETVPTEIGKLSSLKELMLAENYMTGNIPSEVSRLPALERISLRAQRGGNQIDGYLPDFALAGQLWFIDFSQNSISGTIPSSFLGGSNVTTRVVEVYLDNNNIEGTIPSTLGMFSRLDIRLSDNRIVEIPSVLCDNTNWMKGMVGRVGDSKCDAILCPKGYFASSGRQALEDRPCQICEVPDAAQFMGSTTCFENSEREVLGKLYENTSGPQWMNSTLWMSDAPICSWFGIKCQGDEVDDKGIVLIDLPSNGLIGSVPAEVWEMPYIRELNLNDNPELFVSFESLHKPVFNLESLHIARSGNATLAGVSNFRNLRNLTLTGLAGPFPDELFDIRGLEVLNISYGYLVGTIPSRIGELTHLTHILGVGNDFHGQIPKEFSYLSNLEEIVLDENLLSGSLPGTELSALLQLKRLSISRKTKAGRRLSGPMPKFDKLTKLEYFLLGGNDLTGSLPEEFLSGSRAIAMVDLSNNNDLTGTLPPGLISMQRSKLSVPEDLMPGYVPMRSRLQTERELLMSIYSSCGGKSWYRNDFWGTNVDICDWYGVGCHNGHIILLNLQNNNLRGTVPPEVFFLSKLQALWLSSNPITVTFSKIRSSLYLRDMKLDNTSLATLSGLGDATGITSIDLSSNVFTDKAFPAEMLRLSNLRILSMSSSGLVGTLPVTLGSVPLLRSLDLSNNLFNGTLPSWSENVALARVLLHDNTLSGAIPSDFLGRVPSLTRLVVSLNNNQMTGYIPYEFQQGTKLNVNRGTASSGVCTVVNRFGLILSLLLSCFAAFGVLFS